MSKSVHFRCLQRPDCALGPLNPLRFAMIAILAVLLLQVSAIAGDPASPASPWVDHESASVRLISAVNASGNPEDVTGKFPAPLTMGLEFQLAEHWKIYWRSPGDAGFPPLPDWSASENVMAVHMAWPAPVRFSILGFETLGYTDEVVFPLSVTPKIASEPIRLAGRIDYLICSDICVPETVNLVLDIPAGEAEPSAFAHIINKYSARVPGDGKNHGLSIDRLSLDATDPAKPVIVVSARSLLGLSFDNPDVYLEGPDGTGYGAPATTLSDDGFLAELRVPVFPALGGDGKLITVLENARFTVTLADGDRAAEKLFEAITLGASSQSVLPETPAETPTEIPASTSSVSTLMSILGIAFLGGLILNLMPCVLPVLSIKLLGVINHSGSEARTVRLSFLASAAGIIVSFLIIGGALAALKLTGATIGWGIQFQQPWFLASMMLIVIVFACNLWGWFEVRLPATIADAGAQVRHTTGKNDGIGGHFLTGMLATLLATPCSAPFLGTAVGFALARETTDILIVFAMLGLGLSTPYILVAMAPGLATRLPKPGRWMVSLRRILGIALAGTAGWLLWVMSQQVGWKATGISGGFAIGIMIVLYLHHRSGGKRGHGIATAGLVFAIIAIVVPVLAGNDGKGLIKPATELDSLWQPFDPLNIGQLVDEGHTVFVDVTADWCITCQVNKSFVLARSPVIERLESDRIIAMQADWTLPDPVISDYLASFSRYGIPFNAVYGPGAPDGVMLPELLTSDAVIQAINTASGG